MRTSSYAPGLVSLALSDPLLRFSREFRMCSTQYFTSLLNERQHFLFTVLLSDSAESLSLSVNFDQIFIIKLLSIPSILAL